MGKYKLSSLGKNASSNSSGILGSGIHGLLGSTIVCKDSDNSYYCNFIKIINTTIMLFFILFIFYFVVIYVISFLRNTSKSSLSIFSKKS